MAIGSGGGVSHGQELDELASGEIESVVIAAPLSEEAWVMIVPSEDHIIDAVFVHWKGPRVEQRYDSRDHISVG